MTDECTTSLTRKEEQVSNSMKDFKTVSLRVPDSKDPGIPYEGAFGIAMAHIKNVPGELISTNKGVKNLSHNHKSISHPDPPDSSDAQKNIKCHSYDKVLPVESSSSSVQMLAHAGRTNTRHVYHTLDNQQGAEGVTLHVSGEEPSSMETNNTGYSVAQPHVLILSHTDTRPQGNPNHVYHLLDGSNPNEQGIVMEAGSTSIGNILSREQSLRRNVGASNIAQRNPNDTSVGDSAQQPRRTTLSNVPTAPSMFDDPAYVNTTINTASGSIAEKNRRSNIYTQEIHKELPAVPVRSRSLIQKKNGQRKIPGKQETTSNVQLTEKGVVISDIDKPSLPPQPRQISLCVFDDPMYDVGLNLNISGK